MSFRCYFYLDSSESNLYNRKNNDRTRNRSTFEEQFKLVETEKDWYKQFPVTYVDTNRLAVDALESYFAKWLKGRGYEKYYYSYIQHLRSLKLR